ncbi:hypothetical protein N0V88_000738 [Collariella sp. IMI 366227]|nr:hypothetical protein N0V88_000738 [Collariella sp. IMI 366227]
MATDLTEYVLNGLYKRAHSYDIEFTASGYWQALMQQQFPLWQGYAVLCEQSPDDDARTRIDQIVFRIAPDVPLTKLCMVEGKRRGVGAKQVLAAEGQVLAGAKKALDREGLDFVLWRLDRGSEGLTPMDNQPPVPGNRDYYLEIALPEHRALFDNFIALVKAPPQQIPLGGSQADQVQGGSVEGGAQYDAMAGPSSWYSQVPADPADAQALGYQAGSSYQGGWPAQMPAVPAEPGQFEGHGYTAAVAGPSAGAPDTEPWVRVDVTLEKHLINPDKWVFTVGGKVHKVHVTDWQKMKLNDETVWVHRGRKKTYYTRYKPK